jgi:hypothetical protein
MSSSGLATQVCDTPLLRADVTRLDSLGEAHPLEDEGPLSGCHLLTQDACDTRQVLREVQRLGQDVCQLRSSRDADMLHVAILDDLMGEVFPDVNVLGAPPAADDIVPPFNTCRIVLVHRGWLRLRKTHEFEEVAKVKYFRIRRRRLVVLRFGRR